MDNSFNHKELKCSKNQTSYFAKIFLSYNRVIQNQYIIIASSFAAREDQ